MRISLHECIFCSYLDQWLKGVMLNDVQLVRKAVWSSLVFGGVVGDEALISKSHRLTFNPETSCPAELGIDFITNLIVLIKLKSDHDFGDFLEEKTLLEDKLVVNCRTSLNNFPQNTSRQLLSEILDTYTPE